MKENYHLTSQKYSVNEELVPINSRPTYMSNCRKVWVCLHISRWRQYYLLKGVSLFTHFTLAPVLSPQRCEFICTLHIDTSIVSSKLEPRAACADVCWCCIGKRYLPQTNTPGNFLWYFLEISPAIVGSDFEENFLHMKFFRLIQVKSICSDEFGKPQTFPKLIVCVVSLQWLDCLMLCHFFTFPKTLITNYLWSTVPWVHIKNSN